MSDNVSRRSFISGTAAGLTLLGTSSTSWAKANERIRVGVVGCNGRGKDHIQGFNSHKDCEVAAICDVDEQVLDRTVKAIDGKGWTKPKTYTDIRKLLEDKSIDVISVATPNHWHSLAGIWACQAGKDAYVEKPCSHNVFEGRKLVEAAAKYKRVVQHGTQIRSSKGIQEAVDHLRKGTIGEVYMARGLCYKKRGDIGHKPNGAPPNGLNWDIWQGPAQEREFNPNIVHYNWHYWWDYGNGDLGNQGVHQMDIVRWGLGVGLPEKVSGAGGLFIFDDDKQVPNTTTTAFSYPNEGKRGKMLVFEVRPWFTNDENGGKIAALFYGSEGYMVIDSYDHYQIYMKDGEKGPTRDEGGDHYGNFLDAVRNRTPETLNAPIEEGHKSAALCHLGLLSVRLGRSLNFDPKTEKFVGDDEANQYLGRNYRAPFIVPEVV
jgi:predicted dehydrogenase